MTGRKGPYQREARPAAARGVITLPCGAAKTIVAMACRSALHLHAGAHRQRHRRRRG
jgi:hypothetical protein